MAREREKKAKEIVGEKRDKVEVRKEKNVVADHDKGGQGSCCKGLGDLV